MAISNVIIGAEFQFKRCQLKSQQIGGIRTIVRKLFENKLERQTVTEACGTTSLQKNRPKIRSNLTWQIEHVLAKVPAKNQFRRRSKSPAETTEREHGV